MTEPHYVADVTATLADDQVTFETTDPKITQEGSPTQKISEWLLDLREGDPDQAMFDLHPANPSSLVVLARSQPVGGDWTNWTEEAGHWRSPAFRDGDDFTLETHVSDSGGAIRHGSGYFRVRDTGSGDHLT